MVPLKLSAFITAFQSMADELSIEHGNADREIAGATYRSHPPRRFLRRRYSRF